ncbi:MAG TPA: hypothetical protein VMM13_19720 [Euzebya sp.]|nr:hypothetical protein [Euzebya sp.]
MTTKPVRVAADLYEAAGAAGRASSRSAAQQFDYWARLGREISMVESEARARVLDAVAGDVPLASLTPAERVIANAEIDAAVEITAASVSFADRLAAEGVTTIIMDLHGRMVRRTPDGTRTVMDTAVG